MIVPSNLMLYKLSSWNSIIKLSQTKNTKGPLPKLNGATSVES